MRKAMKLLGILLCMVIVFSMTVSFAFSLGETPSVQLEGAASTASKILGAMQWIGYAIAVGMLVFVGIKYIMASADEKANLKNSMIRYVIGAVLIAGAVTIAGWVFEIGNVGGSSGSGTKATSLNTANTSYDVRD